MHVTPFTHTQEAALAAETALGGAPVDTALLEAGTAALLAGGRERCSRVVLTWKYGGLSAYVAGDVVASWAARVPMVRCRCGGGGGYVHDWLSNGRRWGGAGLGWGGGVGWWGGVRSRGAASSPRAPRCPHARGSHGRDWNQG